MNQSADFLAKLRHSAAHLLAAAVLKRYPDAKPTIGPSTDDGFYYDFAFSEPVSDKELSKIEKEMKKIAPTWKSFDRIEVSEDEARERFADNPFKLELIDEIVKRGEQITLYQSGTFIDLCQGGHIDEPNKQLKHVALTSLAGAYWRGNENNPMLTRIYGTAFATKEELDAYLKRREEAAKRNHRVIGKQMELFANIPEIGQGLPVWLPNGYAMRRAVEDYLILFEREYGYQHILTPHIHPETLFQTSGHLSFYQDSMYAPLEIDDQKYYLKPMNCPAGMMVYKLKPKSYRDLPVKLGEFGTVYRYEQSGELHGLQRVRGFTQNDAHIFCTKDQLSDQFVEVLDMLQRFYQAMGFDQYTFRLSLSDPDKEKFQTCGRREDWEVAEQTMRDILTQAGVPFTEVPGEAAFYGPKLDVQALNVYGKEDTVSTIQVDFNLPERFQLTYTDDQGNEQQPFVIHRALVGSFERFFAFLIEHHGGNFPFWYAPVQVAILPVAERHTPAAQEIHMKLIKDGYRSILMDENKTVGNKIRQATLQKIPYMGIIGDSEVSESNPSVSLRSRTGEDHGVHTLESLRVLFQSQFEKVQ